jgi:hypothetical protein
MGLTAADTPCEKLGGGSMEKYKVLMNKALTQEELEYELNNVEDLGWRPILLSTTQASIPGAPVSVTVIFEREKDGPQDQLPPPA